LIYIIIYLFDLTTFQRMVNIASIWLFGLAFTALETCAQLSESSMRKLDLEFCALSDTPENRRLAAQAEWACPTGLADIGWYQGQIDQTN
jgi:hypothetical protein